MRARLWQFTAGYVKIKVEGLKLVQFLNDAAARGIVLRCAERQSYSRVTAETSWQDYRKLLELSAGRPLRVVAVRMGGVPYIAGLAIKRLAFTLGLALCVAALAVVNGFVLDVRVTGCSTPELERRVYAVVEAGGLRPGAAKASVDLHRCETDLMLELSEISFAAIRVNGVVATVNVVEGVPAPEILDKDTPCNIVASRDAVVRKVIVYEGTPQVQAGESVRRGQLLVGGTDTAGDTVRALHARADVMASVWYGGEGSAPLFTAAARRTGKMWERRTLEFAGYTLPAGPADGQAFERYEEETRTHYLLGGGMKGPRLVVTTYYETVEAARTNPFEDAKQAAFLDAVNEARALVPEGAEVLDSRTLYSYEDGSIVAKVYIETLQNIAVEQRIQ